MSEVKHSPLPWRIQDDIFIQAEGMSVKEDVAEVSGNEQSYEQDQANIAFIVKAANAYPRLVEALNQATGAVNETEIGNLLRELGEL